MKAFSKNQLKLASLILGNKNAAIETRDELKKALLDKIYSDPRVKEIMKSKDALEGAFLSRDPYGDLDWVGLPTNLLNVEEIISKYARGNTYTDKYESCLPQIYKLLGIFIPRSRKSIEKGKQDFESQRRSGNSFFNTGEDEGGIADHFLDQFEEWITNEIDYLYNNIYDIYEVDLDRMGIDDYVKEFIYSSDFENKIIDWMDAENDTPHHDQDFNQALAEFWNIAKDTSRKPRNKRRYRTI
jgi:hypothetical protein